MITNVKFYMTFTLTDDKLKLERVRGFQVHMNITTQYNVGKD